MKELFCKKRKRKDLVNLYGLYDIFKKGYFDSLFTTNDVKAMKNDWENVGGDIKWAMKRIKLS